jgi:F0F1-type ATP synthase assembly protein I
MKRVFIITLLLAFVALVAIANINRRTGMKSEKQTEQKTEKKKECKHSCWFS